MGSHFARDGQPNDFMSRGGFFLVIGLIGGGTIALLFAMPLFLRRLPAYMLNVPNRAYWIATDDRRMEALDRLASFLSWGAMATAALLAIAIEFAIRANLHQRGFANGPFIVCLGIYFVFLIALSIQKMHSLAVPEPEPSQ